MNKIDKGTVIRTVLLFVALLNQMLIALGYAPVSLDEETVGFWYTLISTLVTGILAVIAWFKNNYVTWRGRRQRKVRADNGLIKKG